MVELLYENQHIDKLSWVQVNTNYRDDFPEILDLIDLVLCLPASSAICERGFSHMKLIKTDYRNTLSSKSLTHIMRVKLHSDATQSIHVWNNEMPMRSRPSFKTSRLGQLKDVQETNDQSAGIGNQAADNRADEIDDDDQDDRHEDDGDDVSVSSDKDLDNDSEVISLSGDCSESENEYVDSDTVTDDHDLPHAPISQSSSPTPSEPATSSTVPSEPVTSSSVPSQPSTSQPVTSSSVPSRPVTSSSVPSQPSTSQPVTSSSVPSQPVTSSSVPSQPACSSSPSPLPQPTPSSCSSPAHTVLPTHKYPARNRQLKLGQFYAPKPSRARTKSEYGQLQLHLAKINLTCSQTPGDGNCFYHAISDQLKQLHLPYVTHEELRAQLGKFLETLSADDREELENFLDVPLSIYTKRVQTAGVYADHVAVQLTANCLHYNIRIYEYTTNVDIVDVTPNPKYHLAECDKVTLLVGYMRNAEHYVSLIKKD